MLSGIGLISIIIGILAGIPLSNLVLRHLNQTSTGKYRISPKFELPKYINDQFDNLLKKYGVSELKADEQDGEKIVEGENNEVEVVVEQVEPTVIDLILLELEKNRELSIKPSSAILPAFKTHAWDVNRNALDMLPENLTRELTQVYSDMYVANDIIWLISECNRESPELDHQYVKMCNNIADRLSRVILMLETTKETGT
jgi:hypothetical protein